ncbi:MAG: hypothetical protein AAFY60_15095, partial [Myxococcota bacterium]
MQRTATHPPRRNATRLARGFFYALIITDQVRLAITGQPLLLSLIPLALCVASLLAAGGIRGVPGNATRAIVLTVLFCLLGSFSSLVQGMSLNQLIAGWLAYTAFIPALLAFHAVGQDSSQSETLLKTVEFLLVASSLVAFAQQFGILGSDYSRML